MWDKERGRALGGGERSKGEQGDRCGGHGSSKCNCRALCVAGGCGRLCTTACWLGLAPACTLPSTTHRGQHPRARPPTHPPFSIAFLIFSFSSFSSFSHLREARTSCLEVNFRLKIWSINCKQRKGAGDSRQERRRGGTAAAAGGGGATHSNGALPHATRPPTLSLVLNMAALRPLTGSQKPSTLQINKTTPPGLSR